MKNITIGFSGRTPVTVDPSMVESVDVIPNSNRVAVTFTDQAQGVQIDAIHTKGPKGTARYVRSLVDHAVTHLKAC